MLTAPTASGKSALALKLGQRYPLELVCADAFTVYRGLDIGTAKPTTAEQQLVPHHLLDVVGVAESFNVAQFVQLAEAEIGAILERGHIPLVVGGTGFYLSALMNGLPLVPPSVAAQRTALEIELAQRGLEALLAEIAALSPTEAAKMERNPRRVVRTLEVYRQTGQFPSAFGRSHPKFTYLAYAFSQPPEGLETRLEQRVSQMYAAGWAAETSWLAQQVDPQLLPRPTVWQALGYEEALAVAKGHLSVATATEKTVLASRQYIKRQLTFIRTQLRTPVLTAIAIEQQITDQLEGYY